MQKFKNSQDLLGKTRNMKNLFYYVLSLIIVATVFDTAWNWHKDELIDRQKKNGHPRTRFTYIGKL